MNAEIVDRRIVSDDLDPLISVLRELANRDDVNLIITTGGTGLGPRDNTPEATRRILGREAPGIAEAIRNESMRHTPMGMISRGVAGISSKTLIINLPGSPKAVRESFQVIKPVLRHAIDLVSGYTSHQDT
jgi:molybdenum cofactor synthesis domain-containing protein